MRIFIPGSVPSLKNSKIATAHGVFMSKTCKRYLQSLGIQSYSSSRKEVKGYKKKPNIFKELTSEVKVFLEENRSKPYLVGFHFVRDSKRKFDYINAMQILCDLMVAHGIIDDDDCDNLVPSPCNYNDKWYHIDKSNPGVYLDF